MEALSPKSAVVESKPAARKPVRPAATPSLAGIQAASVRLPLCFVLAGVLSLLVSAGFLLAQPDLLAMYHYTPHLIAITHLFVLGFICSIVMGAMYQLVPVTLETQLFSERLVKWQFAAHVIGFIGMVWALLEFQHGTGRRVWFVADVGRWIVCLQSGLHAGEGEGLEPDQIRHRLGAVLAGRPRSRPDFF